MIHIVSFCIHLDNFAGPTEKITDRPVQQLVKSPITVLVSYVAAVTVLSLLVCILIVVGAIIVCRQKLRNKLNKEQTCSDLSASAEDGNEEPVNQSGTGPTDYEEVICKSTNIKSRNRTTVNNDKGNNAVTESSSVKRVGNSNVPKSSQPRAMVGELKRSMLSTKPTRVKQKDSVNRQPCGPIGLSETNGGSGNYMELSPTRKEGIDRLSYNQETDMNLYQPLVKNGDLNRDNVKEPVYNNIDTKAV